MKKRKSSWKLAPPHDALTQGIVVSGFNALPSAQALFLECSARHAAKGNWLQALNEVAPITNADGRDRRAASIAFTWTGLKKLGLHDDVLASFSAPFCEGMYQEDRLRRLGDKINDAWQETVIAGGSRWSANIPARTGDTLRTKMSPLGYVGGHAEGDERQVTTQNTVHALLLLYEEDEGTAQAWAARVEQALGAYDVRVVHRISLDLGLDDSKKFGREHFGFADGLSQPVPFDNAKADGRDEAAVVLIDGRPAERDPWHGVPLGDILLGHTNAYNERSPGPMIPDDPRARAHGLGTDGAPAGFLNFGLNGTYLVVRELRQNVADFWSSLRDAAAALRARDASAKDVTDVWLAQRIIGRSIDGHLLCPNGLLAADDDDFPQNAFGFRKTDPYGYGCPLGSHVRRANPRDGLAKDLAAAQTLLDAANNHRILRRGRKYGARLGDRYTDDNAERGLLFMCLNADIARQFEFIQQRWLLNRNFATLFDETDPLVGPRGRFTVNEEPLRRIVDVRTFIQCAGGEYFFVPSIPALDYLAAL